jgi:hypothetical protein
MRGKATADLIFSGGTDIVYRFMVAIPGSHVKPRREGSAHEPREPLRVAASRNTGSAPFTYLHCTSYIISGLVLNLFPAYATSDDAHGWATNCAEIGKAL